MKKRRSLLICLSLLVISLIMAIVACRGNSGVELKFDTMGGQTIDSVTLKVGEEYTLPTPVWDEAHEFVGWYVDSEYTGSPVTKITAEKSTTFYAKWDELAAITLALDGGTLSEATGGKLYLKAGANLYTFMEAYKPTKTDSEFGAWYVGDKALARGTTMPAAGITLTAKYKIKYTIEAYYQKLDLSGYERGENLIGYEYAGISCTPDPAVDGFDAVSKADSVMTRVISGTASENVFKFYFDRKTFSVVFRSNYPTAAGIEDISKVCSVVYGTAVEIPSDFAAPAGYCMVGWSSSNTGEIEYGSNYIDSKLYNGEAAEPASVTVLDDFILYAVWNRGYTDLFGGKDYIYIFAGENAPVAYLERGGYFFKGEYNERRESFTFRDANNKILLEGVLRADGTYTYYDVNREGYATLYVFGVGIDESVKIFFDTYDEIIYSVQDELGVTTQSKGSYRFDENGYYVAKFTTGELAGREMTFDVGEASVENVKRSVFQIRNDEEYELGVIPYFYVTPDGIDYDPKEDSLILNGFGIAALYDTDNYYYFYYLKEGDVIRLYNANFTLVYIYKIMTVNGITGYMKYNSSLDVTFTSESGATLELDGVCNATYRNGSSVVTGYYTASNSALGGVLIYVTTRDGLYTFYGTSEKQTQDGESVTVYSFVVRPNSYVELYFKNEDRKYNFYYAPLITLDETEAGEISVYGLLQSASSRVFTKIASVSYVYDKESGTYLANLTDYYTDAEVRDMPVDLENVRSFVFDVALVYSNGNFYYVAYWYSVSTDEGTTPFTKVYYEEGGDATLTLVATFAVYNLDGVLVSGAYEENDGILLMVVNLSGRIFYLYFEINEEAHTFARLEDRYGVAYELLADGQASKEQTLFFDGKGGVTYKIGKDDDAVTYVGTYEVTEETTAFKSVIYVFRSDELTFEFIFVSTTTGVTYFARYNETYNGKYRHEGEVLELDGFGYMATLTIDNMVYYGVYYLYDEDVVCLLLSDGSLLYFDIDDRTFTIRGYEYGTYLVYDNRELEDYYLLLDGYGELKILSPEENEDGETELTEIAAGTYSIMKNGYFELVYDLGSASIRQVGSLGYVVINSKIYMTFFVMHEEVVHHYVNETDWSMLILDGFGNAVKLNTLGEAEKGTYILITQTLLYYANSAGTDASIYVYSNEKGTATPIVFDQIGYYTADLESLLFTNYGFMVMGGTTRYYYNVVDGAVLVYHRAQDGEKANEYGFVEETFGTFSSSIVWKGKTYFQNSGYALLFKRAEEGGDKYGVRVGSNDSDKYPLEDLTFTPSGGTAFSVNGSVTINGRNYSCVVTRTVAEDETVKMTIIVAATGVNLVFDIDVVYRGEREDGTSDNTYEITGMHSEMLLPSWTYLYLSYLYAQMGYSIPNSFGIMTIIDIYDEEGEPIEGETYINGSFGVNSFMTDTNDTLVSFKKASYTMGLSGLYTVEFTADDGYLYRVHFTISTDFVKIFGYRSYKLYAFTRVESLDLGDGNHVEIERIMTTESNAVKEGGLYSVRLYLGEERLDLDISFMIGTTLYCIVKGEEDGSYTNITYYIIELVENIPEVNEDDEESSDGKTYYTYLSGTMTVKEAKRYYDGKNTYVDFDAETDEALLIVFNQTIIDFGESTEQNEDGSYTVVGVSGNKFYVEKGGHIGLYGSAKESDKAAA